MLNNKLKVNWGGVKNTNKFNKMFLICLIYIGIFIVGTGVSYAYYALTDVDNSIVGSAGKADLSLEIVNQHPSNDDQLVPQFEKGLATAISSKYNCVDDNNNMVCQVYSIKITNTGTATVKINGTITFGNIDKMPNLKWRLIQDKNTYGDWRNSHYASLNDVNFDSNLTLKKGATKTYYMVIWIEEVDNNQSDTGKYNAVINFSTSNGTGVTSTVGEFNYMKNMGWGNTSYFRSDEYREKIKNASVVDYIDTSSSVISWDVSNLDDNSVVAWLNNSSSDGYYDLYIGSNEDIYIDNAIQFFSEMKNLDSIDLSNLNTIMTTNMAQMFIQAGYNSSNFKMNLGNKFDTRNVKIMQQLFKQVGVNTSNFVLDLGDKFDTSNVTDMSSMFYYDYTLSSLDLGEKFDTSNVTTMDSMFDLVGSNSTNFTLNLGDKFDTTNVREMPRMFGNIGRSNPNFVLNLGSKFSILNATRINGMFGFTQSANKNMILDLSSMDLSSFDTSDANNWYGRFIDILPTMSVYVHDQADKEWLLNNVDNFSGISSDNVIVKVD